MTVINASSEQIEKIYRKYVGRPVFHLGFSYNSDDSIGFVSCSSSILGTTDLLDREISFGVIMEWQMRGNYPCFFSLTKGNIRYDIHYPDKVNQLLYNRLQKLGQAAAKRFWKGGQL